ncbi:MULTISPECIES: GNAT family N-acetyltransferase [Sphingomonas]|jgi:N-acetyltransferase|uniref:GNAT family N-acetyltransferase n=1 Tax=Sphingomonas zeae TaxID=1646122 RepID=A0A7Y6B3D9_9SPHN|nr:MULTISPECIES: GNAT family protein [Sphingomonas]MBB4048250.1 RimJ/RimL family protein N-acetyltransferase [Sphingomonas zeae]MDK8186139.1 GNAT family protein [Sphingomonas zeae]MDK8215662.1 GNAT family protein [Sphingomonas sp. UMB7805-LC452B]NUU46659.1 GNAT family N-acetyltransferase [Sphingomonas zeae]
MSVWTDTPTLIGRHVTLRPFMEADLPALVEAAREGDLWNIFYANVSMMKTPERWLAAALKERDVGRALLFTVETPGGEVVGTTRYMRIAPQHRRLEIGGTFYATRVQRTGVNTEAKRMLLAHAFEVMAAQAVQIRTDALNKRSQTAIERLGAKKDGVLRGHQVMADGRIRDSVIYSIIDREWPGVRANLDYLLGKHA